MLIIGDVHGSLQKYYNIITAYKPNYSIQLGDFGFRKEHEWFTKHRNHEREKICFGNHDHYDYLNSPYSLGDYGMWQGIYSIRGAFSTDRLFRKVGKTWFENEELKYGDFYKIMDEVETLKPEVIVSHDCPQDICERIHSDHSSFQTMTGQGLQGVWQVHQPRMWIFGHHHIGYDSEINGTRFICLPELGILNL